MYTNIKMQKTMKYALSSRGNLKKIHSIPTTHIKFNSWNRIYAASSNLAPFLRSPTPHQKSTQKANDYGKKRIKKAGKYIQIHYTTRNAHTWNNNKLTLLKRKFQIKVTKPPNKSIPPFDKRPGQIWDKLKLHSLVGVKSRPEVNLLLAVIIVLIDI